MKKSSRSLLIIGLFVFVVGALMPVNSLAADVDVYAEGAYTENDLVVYIYADINGSTELRSTGIKLTYDTTELKDANPAPVIERGSDWYLGDGTTNEPYADPVEKSSSGEVVIICGKLDTGDTTAGVSGDRVLLGKVRFARTESSMPFTPDLSLDYGQRGPEGKYANFVDTDEPANVLDDTASVALGSITVRERGDASEDGSIDGRDIRALRKKIGSPDLPCWCDCNDDGVVDGRDIRCLRKKI